MGNRRYHIHIPSFSEYAYRMLMGLSEQQKLQLHEDEQKIVSSARNISKFTAHEPFEKILLLLTKVGYEWVLLMGPTKEAIEQVHFATFNQYDFESKRVDAINAAARERVCAASSHQVMLTAHMCAQNCQTSVYNLSQYSKDLVKAGRSFNKMKTTDEELQEATESYQYMNRVLCAQLNSMDWALNTLGLDQQELRILSILFDKQTSARSQQEISEGAQLKGKKAYLKKYLDKLQADGLITSDKDNSGRIKTRNHYYLITGKGIEKMMKYRLYIHKKTFNK